MKLFGLDLNATRLRAVRGPLGDCPLSVLLAPPVADLPLVLSSQGRAPLVGAAGLRSCRTTPRLAWRNFLPQIAEASPPNRKWFGASSKPDAARALGLAFEQALRHCKGSDGVVLALPVYLSAAQVSTVLSIASQAGLPVLGSIAAPLAVTLAAYAEQAWFGAALVVDVDDQAMTVSTVGGIQGQAHLVEGRALAHLNRRAWQERLLNALADCYVLDSRWDPRESAVAEQSLFDQLDGLLDAAQGGRMMQLSLRTPKRYQNLVLQPHDPAVFCSNLRRQAAAAIESFIKSPRPECPIGAVLLTADAARLPGLVGDLQVLLQQAAAADDDRANTNLEPLEDFGSGLLDDDSTDRGSVAVLTEDAAARGAHSVAIYFQRGDIPSGHLNAAAPLPLLQMRTTA